MVQSQLIMQIRARDQYAVPSPTRKGRPPTLTEISERHGNSSRNGIQCGLMHKMLQSTDQFFLFTLLWTTQYTARNTTPSTYKYSTRTCTSCPTHIVLTACSTCLQPVPYQLSPSIRCHRLLQAPPRLCPATATSGKPALPTSATFP